MWDVLFHYETETHLNASRIFTQTFNGCYRLTHISSDFELNEV